MKFSWARIRAILQDRSALVDLLAILFGISAVIGLNGVYIQLPVLIINAPEGWSLPSQLNIVGMFANLGPLLYIGLQRWKGFRDAYLIYGLLVLNMASTLVMIFLYDQTADIFGAERSVVIFVGFFCASLVAFTSPVLFMPYMGRFLDIYMFTYLIGEGFSGFIPSVVALIQGVGGNEECIANPDFSPDNPDEPELIGYTPPPRFSSTIYFLFVFVMLAICTVAFAVLDKHPRCRKQYAAGTINHGNDYSYEPSSEHPIQNHLPEADDRDGDAPKMLSKSQQIYLQCLLGVAFLLGGGFMPGVMPFALLPYGNVVYLLTEAIILIANPVIGFVAMFVRTRSLSTMTTLAVVSLGLFAYQLVLAFQSPTPLLVGTKDGGILAALASILSIALLSYTRVVALTVLRDQGGKALVWAGAFTQFGTLLGSILSFCVVNIAQLFEAAETC